jgi:hypothetical protein
VPGWVNEKEADSGAESYGDKRESKKGDSDDRLRGINGVVGIEPGFDGGNSECGGDP